MRKKMEWQWEMIEELNDGMLQTYRAKVIGGWVLKSITQNLKVKLMTESMVFIADRDHEWTIVQPLKAEEPKTTNKAADFEPK